MNNEALSDRELLERAAKAAGMSVCSSSDWGTGEWQWNKDVLLYTRDGREWAPLTDDGDALRLAVKLNLWEAVRIAHRLLGGPGCDDMYAATRRAIVRAAASLDSSAPTPRPLT